MKPLEILWWNFNVDSFQEPNMMWENSWQGDSKKSRQRRFMHTFGENVKMDVFDSWPDMSYSFYFVSKRDFNDSNIYLLHFFVLDLLLTTAIHRENISYVFYIKDGLAVFYFSLGLMFSHTEIFFWDLWLGCNIFHVLSLPFVLIKLLSCFLFKRIH